MKTKSKIAVVGAGISGLAAAYHIARQTQGGEHAPEVVVFEAGDYIGGHTHTVDVTVENQTFGVDTGFLVFNERTYPNLIALFKELNVDVAPSEMSFSVSVPSADLEWAGTDLNSVFAQRGNLFNLSFLSMLRDLLRFNKQTTALAHTGGANDQTSLGDFLTAHRYGEAFRDWYLLPMAGAIWSCSTQQMLDFPLATFIRFCHNHGLLQVANRPQWFTVRGGARHYVDKIVSHLRAGQHQVRERCPVHGITRNIASGKVEIQSAHGVEHFDGVILATHSDQALALLQDASLDEKTLLADIRYQPNRAILHTDTNLLPANKRCWAAWNYFSGHFEAAAADSPNAVGVSYLLNKLQPLPVTTPVVVTLNPIAEPCPESVIAEFDYAHPIFDRPALAAQARIDDIQGKRLTWFAGAWLGYGFHEDGLKAGLRAADLYLQQRVEEGHGI